MNAAQVLAYVQRKYPQALQSPVAQACRSEDSSLHDAMEHARRCLDATDGWTVETLSHNIESSFPEFDMFECDDIAEAVLGAQS